MNALAPRLNEWAAAWAPTFASLLWQSTLLAVAVAGVCWALRRQAPALRYGLMLLLAAKLLVLPAWTIGIETPEWFAVAPPSATFGGAATRVAAPSGSDSRPPAASAASAADMQTGAQGARSQLARAPQRESLTWQGGLLALWFAVVAAEVVRTVWQLRRLRGLLSRSEDVNPSVEALVADCARRLNLRAVPVTRQIHAEGSPLVCGLMNPVLVLPVATIESFDAAALRQIILHELAHIRRRDLWTIWIIHAMRSLYWFHPAAHWIAHRAGLERELACDQLAMTYSGASAGAYARTLIRAVGVGAQPIVLTAAAAAKLDGGEHGAIAPPFPQEAPL